MKVRRPPQSGKDDEPLKDATKYEGVARIYGAGHQWPNGYLDIPSGGYLPIVQKLSKVALEINEPSERGADTEDDNSGNQNRKG